MGIWDRLRGRHEPPRPERAPEPALPPAAKSGEPPAPLSYRMARVLEAPSAETWAAFHDAFLRSPVGVIASGTPGGTGTPGTAEGPVTLARTATPDGRMMVLACADRDAFVRRFHARFNREVLGRELARAVLAMPECQGILINSAASAHSLAIDRAQIPALLQRPG